MPECWLVLVGTDTAHQTYCVTVCHRAIALQQLHEPGLLHSCCLRLGGGMSQSAGTTLCCDHRTDLERVLGTNVVGAFSTIQAFYPLLKVSCSAACPSFRAEQRSHTGSHRTRRGCSRGRFGQTSLQHAGMRQRVSKMRQLTFIRHQAHAEGWPRSPSSS